MTRLTDLIADFFSSIFGSSANQNDEPEATTEQADAVAPIRMEDGFAVYIVDEHFAVVPGATEAKPSTGYSIPARPADFA